MVSHTTTHCAVCSAPLTANKRKFCSSLCKSRVHNCYPSQKKRAYLRKKELVRLFGGECSKCGYNRCLAALTFHHIDRTQKSFKLDARSLAGSNWHHAIDEAKKCRLLCFNCHMETHYLYEEQTCEIKPAALTVELRADVDA